VTPEERRTWLEERRTGIGSSDAPAAVGLSKWKTPLQLWMEKRGEAETAESEPMFWGTALEPVVRQVYADRTGRTVVVPGRILRHPEHSFAIATVDGIADETRLYEGKTARTADGWGDPGSADIPQDYLVQVQHAMLVAGLQVADVAVLIGGQDFRVYEVPADAELQAMLLEQERAFWALVISSTPPAPVDRDDVKRRWRLSSGASVTATQDELHKAYVLSQWKEIAKQLEERIDGLTADLQSFMGEAAELSDESGNILATWKNIKASPRFNLDRFREEQPELYRQYLREAGPQRRFLLKVKGEACPQPLPNAPTPALEMAAVP
jgi:putative phage-type endonuclease